MAVVVECVPPELAAYFWTHVAKSLEHAMKRGQMGRFEDVERDVLANNANLWICHDEEQLFASGVTKVTTEPYGRVLTLLCCAGHSSELWKPLINRFEDYARAENCRYVEICGRPGWHRFYPDYVMAKVVLQKELKDGRH
jgi:hypothetical protein